MSRTRRRGVSRVLVSALAAVVAAGLVIHFLKSSHVARATSVDAELAPTAAAAAPLAVNHPGATTSPVADSSGTNSAAANSSGANSSATVDSTAPTPRPVSTAAVEPAFNTPLISSAKSKFDAGDLIPARTQLCDAMNGGQLAPGEIAAAKILLAQIADKVTFGPKVYEGDAYAEKHVIARGETLGKIAYGYAITPAELARINHITNPKRIFAMEPIKVVKGPFNVLVTKSAFTMDLYLGMPGAKDSVYLMTLPVGLGKDDSTPAGTWLCTPSNKLRDPVYYSPRGEGIIPAGDPRNPLKGYWIGLSGTGGDAMGKKSYGIHGTIDQTSIGTQSSMGCIRLRDADIARVFDLLEDGKSTVIVRD